MRFFLLVRLSAVSDLFIRLKITKPPSTCSRSATNFPPIKKPPTKEANLLKQLQRFRFDFRYLALYPFAVLPLPSF